jgi:hypothetical protein
MVLAGTKADPGPASPQTTAFCADGVIDPIRFSNSNKYLQRDHDVAIPIFSQG